jgi:hypothetical protein
VILQSLEYTSLGSSDCKGKPNGPAHAYASAMRMQMQEASPVVPLTDRLDENEAGTTANPA